MGVAKVILREGRNQGELIRKLITTKILGYQQFQQHTLADMKTYNIKHKTYNQLIFLLEIKLFVRVLDVRPVRDDEVADAGVIG